MKKEHKKQKKADHHPAQLPCDPECAFEDLFVTPPHITEPAVDSTYVHESPGILSRLFRKKSPNERKKVA